jgi:hypothetical protein
VRQNTPVQNPGFELASLTSFELLGWRIIDPTELEFRQREESAGRRGRIVTAPEIEFEERPAMPHDALD